MTHIIESEFKLRTAREVDVGNVDALLRESEFECREESEIQHCDTYLDDADRTLAAAGIGLRVRVGRGASRITCKTRGKRTGALFVRGEYEVDWPTPTIPRNAGDLPATLRHVVEPFLLRRPLVAVLRLDIRRQLRRIEHSGVAICDLSLDQATAHGGGRSAQFTELELEVSDDPVRCEALAKRMEKRLDLEHAPNDKPSHAAELLGLPPSPAAPRFDLETEKKPGLATTCRRLLIDILRAETRVRLDEDPKAVHKMRIAVRRLRAILSAFPRLWPKDETSWLQKHLRALTRELGRVRDLDVIRDVVERSVDDVQPELAEGVRQLATWLRTRRNQCRSELVAWLGETERLGDMQRLGALVLGGPKQDLRGKPLRAALEDHISGQLEELQRKARKLRKPVRLGRVHALRIAAKRLRYLIEELGEQVRFPTKKIRKRLVRIQESVGELCDLDVAARTLLDLGSTATAEAREIPGALLAIGALAQTLRVTAAEHAADTRKRVRRALQVEGRS